MASIMVYNPINLCTAGINALGVTAIAAHQFPTRWRQYAVTLLPAYIGTKMERCADLRSSLWNMAFISSVTGGVAGTVFLSYVMLIEECARAFTFIANVLAIGLQYSLPHIVAKDRIPAAHFDRIWIQSHVMLKQFSDVRKSVLVLMATSAVMVVMLWTIGRDKRLSLDALFPSTSESSQPSREISTQ